VCKIFFLFALLLLLIGFINRKVVRVIAIIAVFLLLCREIFYRLDRMSHVGSNKKCFICDMFKKIGYDTLKYSQVKNFSIAAVSTSIIDLSSNAGTIQISSWDKDVVQVKAEMRAKKKKGLERIQVIVNKVGDNKIIINDSDSFILAQKEGNRVIGHVNYEIKVPQKVASLVLKTYSGNITVGKVEADVKIDVSSGNIEVKNVSGILDLVSKSGIIEVMNADKQVKADLASGNIYMTGIQGPIVAQIKSGNIILKDVSKAVNASIYSGNIIIERAMGAIGVVTAKTFSGNVKVKDSFGKVISQGTDVTVE